MCKQSLPRQLKPCDLLPIGSPVSVNGKYGTVTKAESVPAHPSGFICLHTIKLTVKWIKQAGELQAVTINETVKPNYSFIKY